jgi:hypothetical protein
MDRRLMLERHASDGLRGCWATGEVERTTGVGVEQWLGIVARQTRMDRRLLLRLCRLLDRFPTLKAAVAARQVSFAQLRGLGLALRAAPTSIDGELDAFLARLLPEVAGAAPDVVVDQVARAIDELAPEVLDAAERGLDRHLYLQPNLDRTGGRFSGETDAIGLALLDEATAPTRAQRDHPGGQGGARHDNLLGRLAHTCDPDHPSVDAAGWDAAAARGDADATADLPPDATDVLPAERPPPTPARLVRRRCGRSCGACRDGRHGRRRCPRTEHAGCGAPAGEAARAGRARPAARR